MKAILIEIIERQTLKQLISNKINEMFIIGPSNRSSKQDIQLPLLSSCKMKWNPRNIILINECLEEAGVKVTKSKGFYHFTNINIKTLIVQDTPFDACKNMEM